MRLPTRLIQVGVVVSSLILAGVYVYDQAGGGLLSRSSSQASPSLTVLPGSKSKVFETNVPADVIQSVAAGRAPLWPFAGPNLSRDRLLPGSKSAILLTPEQSAEIEARLRATHASNASRQSEPVNVEQRP